MFSGFFARHFFYFRRESSSSEPNHTQSTYFEFCGAKISHQGNLLPLCVYRRGSLKKHEKAKWIEDRLSWQRSQRQTMHGFLFRPLAAWMRTSSERLLVRKTPSQPKKRPLTASSAVKKNLVLPCRRKASTLLDSTKTYQPRRQANNDSTCCQQPTEEPEQMNWQWMQFIIIETMYLITNK